jgi:hypothetical protein
MHRDEFHVPGPGPYALAHSVGCLPTRTAAAIQQHYLQPWQLQGGDAWPAWLSSVDEFRKSLAVLFGGEAAAFCPQANLSSGLAKLLPALPRRPGRTVLLAAEDSFPSMAFVLQQARDTGYETRLIPRAQDPASIGTWSGALTPEVAAALVPHVHSNTGVVAPVADIAALCRERDIYSILDVAQSAGILPVSVVDFAADVLLGSCVKWLCGGPGAGFMWIRPSLLSRLTPTDVGWSFHIYNTGAVTAAFPLRATRAHLDDAKVVGDRREAGIVGTSSAQVLEGHVRVDVGKVRQDTVTVTIPAGAVRVPVDQPLGDLAIVLLEAESPDSFFQWGFMLSVFHEAANSEPYVLEPLGDRMLHSSAALRDAFEHQLATDPVFAGSAERRRSWLLRQTPYADALCRVYPIVREEEETENIGA